MKEIATQEELGRDGNPANSGKSWNGSVVVLLSVGAAFLVCALFHMSDSKLRYFIAMPYIAATILCLIGITVLVARHKQARTLVDGPFLVYLSFFLSYPFSALAHLALSDADPRGFYDLVRTDALPRMSDIHYSFVLVAVAYIALLFGTSGGDRVIGPINRPLRINNNLMLIFGLLFTVVGVIGTLALLRGAPSILEGLLTVNRARDVPENFARYVFLSEWLSWGVTYLAVYCIGRQIISSRTGVLVLTILATLVIVTNIFASGGRGAALVSTLPYLFILQRIRPQFARGPVFASGVILVIFFVAVTALRTITAVPMGVADQALNVFDWQLGRFSMIGLGLEIVRAQGLLWGSTLLHSVTQTINAPSTLLKLPLLVDEHRAITSVVGEHLLGDPEINGILPGVIADLYINLGIVGVASGLVVVGILVNKLTRVMKSTSSVSTFLLGSYAIALISVILIPGTATGWVYFLFTGGIPAIALFVCERGIRRLLSMRE